MCLYPRIIKNKRYLSYITNKGEKRPKDLRQLYVSVGCGNCIECRRQKAREWQVRLNEEIKVHKYNYFVTLTFSCEELNKLTEEFGNENVNTIAQKAVRRFLERYRKKYKVSIKHWLITELGHIGTERIHLHGILMREEPLTNEELTKIWNYGYVYMGDYCNSKTINYIVKYVTKIDADHKNYKPDIFCSAGIGKNYLENENNKFKHRFQGNRTIQYYTLNNGSKINLPTYYRNKLWSHEERAELWTDILDKDRTYVMGMELNKISGEGYKTYAEVLQEQQKRNTEMGYGDNSNEWKEKTYKVTFDMLNNSKKV